MNNIIIELCAEDRARLDRIAALLETQTTQEVKEAEKAPEVKLADIQRLVVELATSGKKEQAREIVTSYAPSVTALPADKYGEVYARLKKVGG